jgi:hypothetical protein
MSAVVRPARFHLLDAEDGLRLVDVEGELRDAEVTSWSALLNAAMQG